MYGEFGEMANLAGICQSVCTNSQKWQRSALTSDDFAENGKFGEKMSKCTNDLANKAVLTKNDEFGKKLVKVC